MPEHEEVGKRKEQLIFNASNDCNPADRKEPQSCGIENEKRGSGGKGSKGKSCRVDTAVEDAE
uniref:Uncharacterized protein n=1 Tax=Peronospora matthiolae TaxID=2874970 RepID=A0AAV1UM78_9STRA